MRLCNVRIIPRLDVKGPNVVKGIHLEGLRVVGNPSQMARYYYEQGADELIYMDVVASLYGRNNLLDIVTKTSTETFIPLAVGGGLRTLEDIKKVLLAGADKVAINTAAVKRPEFIREAAKKFGSSTIIVSIEAIKKPDGTYEAFTDNGREETGLDVFQWARQAVELGAGEIYLTSVDQEGTGGGYDVQLTREVALSVPVPVIACGGAGSLEDIYEAVEEGKADALSMASVIHYNYLKELAFDGNDLSEGNTEYLKKKREFTKVQEMSLGDIKSYLIERGVSCRPIKRQEVEIGVS